MGRIWPAIFIAMSVSTTGALGATAKSYERELNAILSNIKVEGGSGYTLTNPLSYDDRSGDIEYRFYSNRPLYRMRYEFTLRFNAADINPKRIEIEMSFDQYSIDLPCKESSTNGEPENCINFSVIAYEKTDEGEIMSTREGQTSIVSLHLERSVRNKMHGSDLQAYNFDARFTAKNFIEAAQKEIGR